MVPKERIADAERPRWEFFLDLPEVDRAVVAVSTPKGSQLLEPLFEFSGACAGCGETPYLKLLSQLFGDRMLVANATGCSSIFGGNLPTTPWTTDGAGRGPAWANSLFEDNAEFGLGLRLAVDTRVAEARHLLDGMAGAVGADLAAALAEPQASEGDVATQRARVGELRERLAALPKTPDVAKLAAAAGYLVRKTVWIVGGDGWAYDIGFGGLDHVLASGADVNVLVLDTEVYSNTGGQASKSTSRGAVARFAAGGKSAAKKDLGLIAAGYGNVYVAQIAIGANEVQAVKALVDAESYPGPSLVIAYGHCIAHGLDMSDGMSHQRQAVASGYWPLWRFDPRAVDGEHTGFRLDARPPTGGVRDFRATEDRFASLTRTDPAHAAELDELAQADASARLRRLVRLAAAD